MISDTFRTTRKPARLLTLVLLLGAVAGGRHHLAAQSVDTVGPVAVTDEATIAEVCDLVDRFYRFGSDPSGVDSAAIPSYAIDWFGDFLRGLRGAPFWTTAYRYEVNRQVWAIRPEKSILMVTGRTHVDSVPFHGRVAVDWIWYLRENEQGAWRISNVRRTQGILEAITTLRFIDTTSAYPSVLKPEIARDEAGLILDNDRLRRDFDANRGVMTELIARLEANRTITMVAREGTRVQQFNRKYIDWGLASAEIPEEALEEFLAGAPEEVQQNILRRLEVAEKHEREASALLAQTARAAGVRPAEVEEIVRLMKIGRIRFINTEVPFRDAILLTVGGQIEQAVGYLYSPRGELPWINPEEYFYLEELGDGWWIFRSA